MVLQRCSWSIPPTTKMLAAETGLSSRGAERVAGEDTADIHLSIRAAFSLYHR